MGTDKGLIQKDGQTWAEIAADKIAVVNIPVFASINGSQRENYTSIFGNDRLIIDSLEIQGPLCGLLSLHNAFPYHDLLILACDMVDVKASLIKELLSEFRNREGEHDFIVFKNKGELEPLFGIYTREGLEKITNLFYLGKLEKQSLKYILEIGNTYEIPLSEENVKQFTNYNS